MLAYWQAGPFKGCTPGILGLPVPCLSPDQTLDVLISKSNCKTAVPVLCQPARLSLDAHLSPESTILQCREITANEEAFMLKTIDGKQSACIQRGWCPDVRQHAKRMHAFHSHV